MKSQSSTQIHGRSLDVDSAGGDVESGRSKNCMSAGKLTVIQACIRELVQWVILSSFVFTTCLMINRTQFSELLLTALLRILLSRWLFVVYIIGFPRISNAEAVPFSYAWLEEWPGCNL